MADTSEDPKLRGFTNLGGHPEGDMIGPCVLAMEDGELVIRPDGVSSKVGSFIKIDGIRIGDIEDNPNWASTATSSMSVAGLVGFLVWQNSDKYGWSIGERILAMAILSGIVGMVVAVIRHMQARPNRRVLHLFVTDVQGTIHDLRFGVAKVRDPVAEVRRFLCRGQSPLLERYAAASP
jgi:hypothetical protein